MDKNYLKMMHTHAIYYFPSISGDVVVVLSRKKATMIAPEKNEAFDDLSGCAHVEINQDAKRRSFLLVRMIQ